MRIKTATDELDSVARMLCERYPHSSENEISSLVRDVYARLSAEATVTAHLIPLTVNRCQRMLTKQRNQQATGRAAVNPVATAS